MIALYEGCRLLNVKRLLSSIGILFSYRTHFWVFVPVVIIFSLSIYFIIANSMVLEPSKVYITFAKQAYKFKIFHRRQANVDF